MSGVSSSHRHLAWYLASPCLYLTLTSPTQDETVTTSTPTITWTFAPGTQVSYRVYVALLDDVPEGDPAEIIANAVYDSGVMFSADSNHTLPDGTLDDGEDYWVYVEITTDEGQCGNTADPSHFDTNFAPSANVSNVRLQRVGHECDVDSRVLPHVIVRWDQIVPAGTETFRAYYVRRRVAGETNFTRIARITDVATTSYADYCVAPGTTYEYAVVWEALDTGLTLVSVNQSPAPQAQLDFDWLFLHLVEDPTVFVRYDAFRAQRRVDQDVEFRRTWGRELPTGQIGEQFGAVVQVPGRPDLLSDRRKWDAITSLLTGQRDQASVICARFGRARTLMFCQASGVGREERQKDFSPSLTLTEVYYTEGV